MKLSITNLQRIEIERKKVLLIGQKGHVELACYGGGTFSIMYTFSQFSYPQTQRKISQHMFSPGFHPGDDDACREWDEIEEHNADFLLSSGENNFFIDKATATVAVYHKELLVHGGKIGDKDTVLPDYPLRVQFDSLTRRHTGKFNFHLEKDDAFFGLGEKSGNLNKRNRRFKMFNRDSLGYNAELSDPLYKSIPFLIKMNRVAGSLCGLFFPNLDIEEFDLGVESNYYYHLKLNGGPYGYFLFTGDTYHKILSQYTAITGRPALPPLFTFGFMGSSMSYTESEDAEDKVEKYFDTIENYGIPCEGMYFSSGYVKAENGERYSLLWNRKKFKNPKTLIHSFLKRGYRICCNIKPGFLTTHPWYRELADQNLFLKDGDGNDFSEYYWGNTASFIDFSQDHAYAWWKKQLKEHFIKNGITGIWNDNNEFELEDESVPAHSIRTIFPMLMSKAAYEALREEHPGKRPWVISRSGCAGMQRYARTWTGDNVSDYTSLAYNVLMGLNLGLSGVPFYGHDIGGFFGDKPDEDLLVRWCQSAVFQPRFVIHSWNSDGIPTEPWSYPDAAERIIELVREHYRFIPYIYNCAIEAARSGVPVERPLALEFPRDTRIQFDDFNFLFGDAILVIAPVKAECEHFSVYLPEGNSWYDPFLKRLLPGGQSYERHYPLEGVRYLVRSGSIVPTTDQMKSLSDSFFRHVHFQIFPDTSGKPTIYTYYEDDGESDFTAGSYNEWKIETQKRRDASYSLYSLRLKRISFAEKRQKKENRTFSLELPEGFTFLNSDSVTITIQLTSGDNEYHFEFQGDYLVCKNQ
ncbi:TIM-barrel domain-containing protein [Marispirochaeta sp.]|uniref:glycoside hydrolase family 31 protein n=1 Tax=Marispirochaeta sp. TaxID=2038653 RepID=UPI0029C96C8F|nr:TIM-barrel domain-containing protein [Marispirochaeta sp.]